MIQWNRRIGCLAGIGEPQYRKDTYYDLGGGMMTGCNDDLETAPRKTAVYALPAVDAGSTKMINAGSGCIDI